MLEQEFDGISRPKYSEEVWTPEGKEAELFLGEEEG